MILIPKYNNMVKIDGSLSIIVTDTLTSKVKQELYVPNAIQNNGKEYIASRMIGTAFPVMSHMGIGLGSESEATGAWTALQTELTVGAGYTGYTRSGVAASNSGNLVTYTANFNTQNPSAPSGGAVLREAGIFNASSGGTMLCRTTFPAVTKLPLDALTITWTVTIQ